MNPFLGGEGKAYKDESFSLQTFPQSIFPEMNCVHPLSWLGGKKHLSLQKTELFEKLYEGNWEKELIESTFKFRTNASALYITGSHAV